MNELNVNEQCELLRKNVQLVFSRAAKLPVNAYENV